MPDDLLARLTPAALGFRPEEPERPAAAQAAWSATVGRQAVRFRLLRRLDELALTEALQRDVMGMSEADLSSAVALLTVHETGGEVIGAFLRDDDGERLSGFCVGWGGFVGGRPRLASDILAVRREARALGLGAALKRLQAAVAAAAGFDEVVWTVDPLRAANARLNFGKLGAYSDAYERDRYGAGFAAGLYGGMPTDRLHVTWPLASRRVQRRLLGGEPLHDTPRGEGRTIPIPADIDGLVASDPAEAAAWRFRLRAALETAFAAGWAITGFRPAAEPGDAPALILERLPRDETGRPLLDADPDTVIGGA